MNPDPSSWELTAQIAQVASTVLTGVGVIVSLILGIRSLRAIQEDRIERARPYLLFQRGAHRIPTDVMEIHGIPGINPVWASRYLGSNAGRESFSPKGHWSRLYNYGNGAALEARVMFLAHTIRMGSEQFTLDRRRLTQYPYDPKVNSIPPSPSHILPGTESQLFRFPTFYIADFEKRLDFVECVAVLQCKGITGEMYVTYQVANFWIREDGRRELHATFGSELSEEEAAARFNELSLLMQLIRRRPES